MTFDVFVEMNDPAGAPVVAWSRHEAESAPEAAAAAFHRYADRLDGPPGQRWYSPRAHVYLADDGQLFEPERLPRWRAKLVARR